MVQSSKALVLIWTWWLIITFSLSPQYMNHVMLTFVVLNCVLVDSGHDLHLQLHCIHFTTGSILKLISWYYDWKFWIWRLRADAFIIRIWTNVFSFLKKTMSNLNVAWILHLRSTRMSLQCQRFLIYDRHMLTFESQSLCFWFLPGTCNFLRIRFMYPFWTS